MEDGGCIAVPATGVGRPGLKRLQKIDGVFTFYNKHVHTLTHTLQELF